MSVSLLSTIVEPYFIYLLQFSSRRTDTTNDTESEHDVEKGDLHQETLSGFFTEIETIKILIEEITHPLHDILSSIATWLSDRIQRLQPHETLVPNHLRLRA
ncbi:hypothetical protein HID58_039891 [Brassica napus]|uniref:Uncharacterized protein n=1 Tax=Brassica napus TaxID=3708 RepID=A0ABQ8BTB0_BRANA|nr:hypothetical protein HID58_039891 [Brassica napus]